MTFRNFVSASLRYCDLQDWEPAPYIRKSFQLSFVPQTAPLCICTPGFYELYVNGQRVTKGELAPYISNPDQVCFYDTYDIAPLLTQGENVLGVILGNGFANQCIESWNFSKASFRAPLSVALELQVCGEEKTLSIGTDESFRCSASPVLFDMYRYGMQYDARLEQPGWNAPGFDDSAWQTVRCVAAPKGALKSCQAQPVTVEHELSPKNIQRQQDFHYLHRSTAVDSEAMPETYVADGWVYDFGFSCAGVCRLKIRGHRGQKITLRHGEALRDGKFCLNSIYTFKEDYADYIHLFQTDTYILKGGEEEIFTPFFTYHGFRYVLVEGITPEQATEDLLTFVVFHSDIPRRAWFSCSDSTLNTLYDMGIRADLSNFHYFPTDCPHREKNGWTGDTSVSAPQLLLNFDCSQSFGVWMETIRYTQLTSGMLPAIIPTTGWGYAWGNGPTWDAAIINMPFYTLRYDGSIGLFRENAEMISRYLHYIAGRRDERGLVDCGLGDWSQPNPEQVRVDSLELTESCMVLDMARKSCLMFRQIGDEAESKYTSQLAQQMLCAIREHLIDETTMTAKGNCQAAQALALAMDIFTPEEYPIAYRRLLQMIEEKGRHAYCGMLGLRYLFHVLCQNGDADLAYEMIVREDEPSYGSMIKRGGTALFESAMANGVQESQNHHFLGDILQLFIRRFAGLDYNPELTDDTFVRIAPCIIDALDHAEASFASKWGMIQCGWKRENGKITLHAELPEGVHGMLCYDGQAYPLNAGVHQF